MPVLMRSVHVHILTKPSRAGFAVNRFELIEPGAATCVYRHAWAVIKKLGTYVPGIYHNVLFFFLEKMLPTDASANSI